MASGAAHKKVGPPGAPAGKKKARADAAGSNEFRPLVTLVTDLLLVAWLAVVGAAYLLLVLFPNVPTRREVPGIAELEPLVLPLLLSLVVAAIIRYFCLRSPGADQASQGTVPPVEGQDHL